MQAAGCRACIGCSAAPAGDQHRCVCLTRLCAHAARSARGQAVCGRHRRHRRQELAPAAAAAHLHLAASGARAGGAARGGQAAGGWAAPPAGRPSCHKASACCSVLPGLPPSTTAAALVVLPRRRQRARSCAPSLPAGGRAAGAEPGGGDPLCAAGCGPAGIPPRVRPPLRPLCCARPHSHRCGGRRCVRIVPGKRVGWLGQRVGGAANRLHRSLRFAGTPVSARR